MTNEELVDEYGLTQHEFNIAYLISQGIKREEVARRLNTNYWMVKYYLKGVYVKMDVHSVLEMTEKLERQGL